VRPSQQPLPTQTGKTLYQVEVERANAPSMKAQQQAQEVDERAARRHGICSLKGRCACGQSEPNGHAGLAHGTGSPGTTASRAHGRSSGWCDSRVLRRSPSATSNSTSCSKELRKRKSAHLLEHRVLALTGTHYCFCKAVLAAWFRVLFLCATLVCMKAVSVFISLAITQTLYCTECECWPSFGTAIVFSW
jgi:hypothetical protein